MIKEADAAGEDSQQKNSDFVHLYLQNLRTNAWDSENIVLRKQKYNFGLGRTD